MNPQSFAKFPGHFLAKQTVRLLCCCALLVVWLTASPVAHAGTTWDGGGGDTNINTAANWDLDTVPTSLTDGTQTLTFGTGGSTATINTNVNALGLVINRDAPFTIANGAGSLTIGNGTVGTITVNPGSTTARAHVISESNLILAGNQTWAVTNTGVGSGNMQLTVSSGISGNFGIIKTGTGGILFLSGSNSFSGGVIVRDGFLNLANTAALGSGTLTLGDNTVTASTTSLTLNFDTTSGTYANDITFVRNGQSQTKTIQSRVSNATLNGTITLARDARFAASASNALTINGKITGSTGTVVTLLNSQGTVVLANANNDFNSGVSDNLFNDRGTLLLRGNDSAGVGGAAGVLGAGTGQLNFGNNNANGDNAQVLIDGAYTIARAVNMNQGAASSTSTLGGNTSDTSTFSGNIALASGSNTSFRLTAATNGTVNFTGVISGTATNGLSKIGNGTVVLTGNNTYAGATAINAGALNVQNVSALGGTANGTTVATGAALQLQGGITVGAEALSLSGTGVTSDGSLRNISGNNIYGGTITLATAARINSDAGLLTLTGGISGTQDLTIGGAGNTTISSVIGTSSGTLTKDGSGILTLSGTNTYNGTTTISAGTLLLSSGGAGTAVLSSSSAIINNGTLAFDAAANLSYSNTINGTGSVTHTMSVANRRVSLTGSNSYSGGTFVSNDAMLAVAADNNLGAASGALTLGNGTTGGVLRIDQTGFTSATRSIVLAGTASGSTANKLAINFASGTASFGGNISGSGNLDLTGSAYSGAPSGTGTVVFTLSGNNIYTGATSISNNVTVRAGSSTALGNNSAVTLQGTGSTLDLNNNNLTIGSLASSVSSNVTLGNRTLTTGGDNTSTSFAGVLAGAGGGLTKAGTGTLTLTGSNTYTGATTINAGTLSIATITNGGVAGALGNSTNAAGNLVLGGGTLEYTGSGNSTDRNFTLTAGTTSTISVTNSSAALTISGTSATTNGALTKAGSGTLILTGNNTYSGTTTINAGTLLLSSGGAGTPVLSSSSAIINNSALAFNAAANLSYSNTISGTGSVTHTMSAANRRVTLSGNNSYSGGTFVSNDAMLAVAADNNLGAASGALTLGNGTSGGVLRIDQTGFTSATRSIVLAGTASGSTANKLAINFASVTASFGGNISGSGNLDLTGSAYSGAPGGTGTVVFTLSGNNTYTGATSISNNVTVRAGSSTALGNNSAVTLQGTGSTLDLNNNNLTIGSLASSVSSNVTLGNRTLTTGGDNTSTSFAGVLAGSGGGLTKTGTGTLTLTGSNTYTGATTISSGNISISSTTAVGSTSSINLANATALIYNGSAATLDRAITVTSGTGTIRNTGGALTLSGALSKNGTTLTLAGGSNGITVSGVISGSNANSDLIIDGGTTTLANANTYNGPTSIINGGTLNANFANALPTANLSAISIDATGTGSSTLALGANQQIASLAGAASSTVALGSNMLVINSSSGNATYAGSITGTSTSALLKQGASTQVLTGNNTGFTGATTINGGTLQAAAAGALGGTSSIDISGGSLLVSAPAAINQSASINLNGGTLAFSGNYNGSIGSLTLSANSIIDLGQGNVGLAFADLAAGLYQQYTLSFYNWSGTTKWGTTYGNGTDTIFFGAGNYTASNVKFYSGAVGSDSFVGSGFEVMPQTTWEGGFTGHYILPVPEPETWATGILLLLGGAWWMIKRTRKAA